MADTKISGFAPGAPPQNTDNLVGARGAANVRFLWSDIIAALDLLYEPIGAVAAHEGAADPHGQYQKESEKGAAGGYASLDGGGTVPDAQIPAGIARDSEITAAITAHEGAADPHSVYLTQAEADLLYAAIVHTHTSGSITDFTEAAQDAAAVLFTPDDGDIDFTYNDATPSVSAVIKNAAVTLAKIANIASGRILGRITAGAGVIEELTSAQVTSMLDVFTSLLKGLVPASGGGTTNFLRADGNWAAPTAVVGDYDTPDSGTRTVATGKYHLSFKRYELIGSQRLTLQGTGRLRIFN